jgi:hypothetical protein
MKRKKLKKFFKSEDFNVHLFEQDEKKCAEVETWTNGGVNMIITLMPFSKKQFIERVESFNVDEEIDLHRQDPQYKNAFSISDSVKDFTDFHNRLKEVVAKL